MRIFFFAALALALISCEPKKETVNQNLDIDALLDRQIILLTKLGAKAEKSARIGDKQDQVVLLPDSAGWSAEFEVFRFLNEVNRPIHSESYEREEGVPDPRSNLKVISMKATKNIPIKEFMIYYLERPDDIRQIEATVEEQNTLYYSCKKMSLQLDSYQDEKFISQYRISGMQKMVLQDTVEFEIEVKTIIK